MQPDQESSLVLSVIRGNNNQWPVTAQDFHETLASFDNPQAACAWAIARAKPERGRVFVEELTPDSAASARDSIPSPDRFKFSIPLTWTDNPRSRLENERPGFSGENYRRYSESH